MIRRLVLVRARHDVALETVHARSLGRSVRNEVRLAATVRDKKSLVLKALLRQSLGCPAIALPVELRVDVLPKWHWRA